MPAKPTAKQAKALELIRQGTLPTTAMRQAGYTPDTSTHPTNNLLRSAGAQQIIEKYRDEYVRQGIIPQSYVSKVVDLMEANKLSTSLTEPDRVVPDWTARAKGLEIYRKDAGLESDMPTLPPIGEMTINFN